MTTTQYTNRRTVKSYRYPNAADRRYFWNRLADIVLCTASGIGVIAILLFLLTMG